MPLKLLMAFAGSWLLCSLTTNRAMVKEKIHWLTIEEVNLRLKNEQKPVLIDLYTNWCVWCKVMDKRTYSNAKVARYINEHFYPVKINAESKEDINWNGKKYSYDANNKLNSFAFYVTENQPSFPATIIFPDVDTRPAPVYGLLSPRELEKVVKYFGEGNYKMESFQEFSKIFKSTW
jgi:thioredoxin-related protein